MKFSVILMIFAAAMIASASAQTRDEAPEWMPADLEPPDVTAPAVSRDEPAAQPAAQEAPEETVTFYDVPDSHWAKDAVYDLVKMGITQGYPDGTFRGNRNINRYETAMFLSRMAGYLESQIEGVAEARKKEFDEKYYPKLMDSLDEIRKEIEILRSPEIPRPQFGWFEAGLMAGNLTSVGNITSSRETAAGPRFDWRTRLNIEGGISEWLYGEAHFDTMDAGWGGGTPRKLVTEMIDVGGRATTPYGFDLIFTAGPGTVVHSENAGTTFPSENGVAFMRPRNSFGGEGKLFGADLNIMYSTLSIAHSGEVQVSNYHVKYGYNFDEDTSFMAVDELYALFDYNVRERDPRDAFKESLHLSFSPKWFFDFGFEGGVSNTDVKDDHSYYVGSSIRFRDLLKDGMILNITGKKVGKSYMNSPAYLAEESLLGVDFFDRLYYFPSGGADVGIKLTQDVSDATSLTAKGVVVLDNQLSYGEDYPGTYSTFDIRMDYLTYTFSSIGFLYRIYHEPSASDMAVTDTFAIIGRYEF